MSENFQPSPAQGGTKNRDPVRAAAAGATLADPESRARRSSLRIDERRLQEAVSACGYDARRISRHLGISVRQLQRWFNAHLASTPAVWLAEQRLEQSRRLLAASSSVKEVAHSLGFNHVSQFSRDFKRRFGHQPSVELERTRLVRAPTLAAPSH